MSNIKLFDNYLIKVDEILLSAVLLFSLYQQKAKQWLQLFHKQKQFNFHAASIEQLGAPGSGCSLHYFFLFSFFLMKSISKKSIALHFLPWERDEADVHR